jgi:CDP-paratose 2-epimerase
MTRQYLITGGAGFIGSNYVHRLMKRGEKVRIFDNFVRAGAPRNLEWLKKEFGEAALDVVVGDIRDADRIAEAGRDADVIVHLASQVAVTTSVTNPREDFEVNALGTFNVLEAARLSGRKPIVLYSSTNKVYGGMDEVEVVEDENRWHYKDLTYGASEEQALDFHSPYGCSKGTGDQYVRDYYRIYDIPTVVLRQSAIYGPRQFGVEDQGWLAWFMIAAVMERPITIFGDGKQVRDMLFVDDLLNAYDLAIANIDVAKGQVYNMGGGVGNVLAVWSEFGPMLEKLLGKKINVARGDWRPGDQRVFYADYRKAERELGWKPQVSLEEGIERLFQWVQENKDQF